MPRPYGIVQYDNSVYMVRHYHKSIQIRIRKMTRNTLPTFHNNRSHII